MSYLQDGLGFLFGIPYMAFIPGHGAALLTRRQSLRICVTPSLSLCPPPSRVILIACAFALPKHARGHLSVQHNPSSGLSSHIPAAETFRKRFKWKKPWNYLPIWAENLKIKFFFLSMVISQMPWMTDCFHTQKLWFLASVQWPINPYLCTHTSWQTWILHEMWATDGWWDVTIFIYLSIL